MKRPETPFSLWLGATMASRGLSQADVARELGVADAQISRWRRGQVRPTVQYLQRIADTFGVSRIELDRLAGYPVERDLGELRDPVTEAELQAHLAALRAVLEDRVPPHLWRAYVEACEALAEGLAASFGAAQERLREHRPIGFRTNE